MQALLEDVLQPKGLPHSVRLLFGPHPLPPGFIPTYPEGIPTDLHFMD
jgi:hypothetical protein